MFKRLLNKMKPPIDKANDLVRILRKGRAMRVIFFYPGEEGTYIDNADVTLYDNGIVHIQSTQEETTTNLANCEILWRFEVEAEERLNKVRLLKPKSGKTELRNSLLDSAGLDSASVTVAGDGVVVGDGMVVGDGKPASKIFDKSVKPSENQTLEETEE